MVSCNGNLLCAVDTETTGLDIEFCDLWQLSIIPLKFNLDRDETRPILDLWVKPDYLDNPVDFLDRSGQDHLPIRSDILETLRTSGVSQDQGRELFLKWFDKLNLAEGKRIVPMAHNWKFDHQFIQKFLGHALFGYLFDSTVRDTMTAAIFVNDVYELEKLTIPFPKLQLGSICTRVGVTLERAHDSLEDARVLPAVYQGIMSKARALRET